MNNLLKFACNLDPTIPDARRLTAGAGDTVGLPDGQMVVGVLRLEFLRRKAGTNPGVTYTPQFSGNLGSRTDYAGPETVTSINATWERVLIDDTPPPGSPARFGRVRVLLNP